MHICITHLAMWWWANQHSATSILGCWQLTHQGWDKMDAILQTFSNAFSWMNILAFWLKFHRTLFLGGLIDNNIQIMAWHPTGDTNDRLIFMMRYSASMSSTERPVGAGSSCLQTARKLEPQSLCDMKTRSAIHHPFKYLSTLQAIQHTVKSLI